MFGIGHWGSDTKPFDAKAAKVLESEKIKQERKREISSEQAADEGIRDGPLRYDRLPSETAIRILFIETELVNYPSGHLQCLKCRLETIPALETLDGDYRALSYVWGATDSGQQKSRIIALNGLWATVKENLWLALSNLQDPRDEQRIWVDALCINQSNIPERNQQVRLMSRIFSEAQSVIAWLGMPRSDDIMGSMAMSYLAMAGKPAETDTETGGGRRRRKGYFCECVQSTRWMNEATSEIETMINWCNHGDDLCTTGPWYAVAELLHREFFYRMWIVQEIVLAKKIYLHCGQQILDWEHISRLRMGLPQRDTNWGSLEIDNLGALKLISSPAFVLDEHRARARQSENKGVHMQRDRLGQLVLPRIVDLLPEFKASKCQDPRDRVYAVLSFARDRDAFAADYSKPLWKLQLEVARARMKARTEDRNLSRRSEFESFVTDHFVRSYREPECFQFIAEIFGRNTAIQGRLSGTELHSRMGSDLSNIRYLPLFEFNTNPGEDDFQLRVIESSAFDAEHCSEKQRAFLKSQVVGIDVTLWEGVEMIKKGIVSKNYALEFAIMTFIEEASRKTQPKIVPAHDGDFKAGCLLLHPPKYTYYEWSNCYIFRVGQTLVFGNQGKVNLVGICSIKESACVDSEVGIHDLVIENLVIYTAVVVKEKETFGEIQSFEEDYITQGQHLLRLLAGSRFSAPET